MSARKLQTDVSPSPAVTLEARKTRLTLPPEAVVISKSGIEFRSETSFALWTEMTVALELPHEGTVNCTGVVVSCAGNRHRGYYVSMAFTSLSKQSEARLNTLAYS